MVSQPKLSQSVPITELKPIARSCPHCGVHVLTNPRMAIVSRAAIEIQPCIHCHRDTILIAPFENVDGVREALGAARLSARVQVIPPASATAKDFPNAPQNVAEAYKAAVDLKAVYAPAAAAMARKAMELLLESRGYNQRQLVDKISAIATESDPNRRVSSRLHALLTALREFGNIGLHVVRSRTTAEIVDVEDGEVDLCLTTIEELITEICERPAQEKAMLRPIANKLRDAGKGAAADIIDKGINS